MPNERSRKGQNSQAEQDYLEALARLESGAPTNSVLIARLVAGKLRVSYVGAPPDSNLPFQTTYDGANRAVVLKMMQPFEAFRTVKVELLDGIKAFDGGPVTPWTVTFSVGG